VRLDLFGCTYAMKLGGVAIATIALLAGCGSQHIENYDAAQCGALGGAMVRQTDYSSARSGLRIETQRCAFSPGPGLRESP
jgi:hypothetical protein